MLQELDELRTKTGQSLSKCREALKKYGNFRDAYKYIKEHLVK
jgi:translation elongation factor EF-Ts